ncbi:MAG: signal recognition particle protein [Gammaproteobacteria bacterium]|nr:signal recognition particle protein [Gammaproteobacteria bacterium]
MFENLTGRFSRIIRQLRGHARLTEDNVADAMRDVRRALLEADVALPVVKAFIERVESKALGREVATSLSPGQAVVKIVQDELIHLMGDEQASLNLSVAPPAVILMAGLQGAGKTTTVAKLGNWCRDQHGKSVVVASCDIYRPAALEQLRVLAEDNGLEYFPADSRQKPVDIAKAALKHARARFADVLIVDSAGRLHIDEEMMAEIQHIHGALEPSDTLFLVDSMMGQDAVNAARAFNDALDLTGIILTKVDGDARGGAALSVRHVTGKPIVFLGTGEKTSELSLFHPDRIASRILGMGDVLSLIEEVESKTDQEKAKKIARKLKKGRGFDLDDYRDQVRQMQRMGGLGGLLDKMPGMQQMPANLAGQEREMGKMVAVINSMTPGERRFPAVINGSRKKRIASGSGTQIQDVNRLLKQFSRMQKMMKKLSKKGGMENMMRTLESNMPRGFGR